MPFDRVRHDFELVSVAKSFAAPFRLVPPFPVHRLSNWWAGCSSSGALQNAKQNAKITDHLGHNL